MSALPSNLSIHLSLLALHPSVIHPSVIYPRGPDNDDCSLELNVFPPRAFLPPPPPPQHASFLVKAQQYERLLERRLLHEPGVHVLLLLERVQSLFLDVGEYFCQVGEGQKLGSEAGLVSAGERTSLVVAFLQQRPGIISGDRSRADRMVPHMVDPLRHRLRESLEYAELQSLVGVAVVQICHDPRHEGLRELQEAVIDVLEEGVMRQAAHGEHC